MGLLLLVILCLGQLLSLFVVPESLYVLGRFIDDVVMHVFITHLLIAIRQLADLLSLLLVDVCETALLGRCSIRLAHLMPSYSLFKFNLS